MKFVLILLALSSALGGGHPPHSPLYDNNLKDPRFAPGSFDVLLGHLRGALPMAGAIPSNTQTEDRKHGT